jgi:hypothetical protein
MLASMLPQHWQNICGHWEPLGVSEDGQNRITGWSNARVYRIDAVDFRYIWDHLCGPATSQGALANRMGAPRTNLRACRITVEQSRNNTILFGNNAGAPGNDSYYLSLNDV